MSTAGASTRELEAYYFVDELELIIREWIAERYHRRAHQGLVVPEVPGLELSPNDAFELGVARAGRMLVPARADLVYDFLPVAWRTIQHYGVELHGLRYDGPGLNAYRNRRSDFTGAHAGKWPVRFDPDDIRRVFFQDPHSNEWHTLWWEHHSEIAVPFSAETLAYARRLARQTDRFPDDRRALARAAERWDAGLTRNPTERRMALRLAQQREDRLRAAGDEEGRRSPISRASARSPGGPAPLRSISRRSPAASCSAMTMTRPSWTRSPATSSMATTTAMRSGASHDRHGPARAGLHALATGGLV